MTPTSTTSSIRSGDHSSSAPPSTARVTTVGRRLRPPEHEPEGGVPVSIAGVRAPLHR